MRKAGTKETATMRNGSRGMRVPKELQRRQQQMQLKRFKRFLFLFSILTWGILFAIILSLVIMRQKIEQMNELLKHAEIGLQLPGEKSSEKRDAAQTAAQQNIADYSDIWGLDYVDRPVERTERQVQERLEELAEENELIKEICERSYLYPPKMLEALANNPEMAGYVASYPDAEKKASGGLTENEKEKEFPLFLQWDPRWGYAEYGNDSNIGLTGCGRQ